MRPLPHLHWMPRVDSDIERCLSFVARQPWSRPDDRARDIDLAIEKIQQRPRMYKVGANRRSMGLRLRRHSAAQFAIIYAYLPPSAEYPSGLVTIRAVRHTRVKNVFSGVKEPDPPQFIESFDF